VAVADVDTGFTARVRAMLPSLEHRRPDVLGDGATRPQG